MEEFVFYRYSVHMLLGLLFAILACFIWGTIFVIPQFVTEFSSLEVALGRYFCYGLLSCCLFLSRKNFFTSIKKYPKEVWKAAFLFAIFSNILYYPGLVLGLRLASPTATVMILGMCPILVAFYGNWKGKEVHPSNLVMPMVWIFIGILLVNIVGLWQTPTSFWKYSLGILGAMAALCSWSFYAIHNAQFLKRHPEIPKGEWATIIGVATFIGTSVLLCILGFFPKSGIDFHKFLSLPLFDLLKFIISVAFLGIFCSWIGCYLWNEASAHLPLSLMGSLIIFETLFGLFFVFIFEWRLPTLLELSGIIAMLYGITTILNHFRKQIA